MLNNIIQFVSLVIILAAPVLAGLEFPFTFVDNIFMRILLVAGVVYAVRIDLLTGLLALLAALSILIERNHQILKFLPGQIPKFPNNQAIPKFQAPPLEEEDISHLYEDHNKEEADFAHGLEDSNPRLSEGPNSSEDSRFYLSKGLI
jgi:hypothetical protein